MLASLQPDIRKRGFAFARTIQGQLSQAIQLGRALDRLSLSEQRFRRVAEAVAEALLISERDGRVTFMNEASQWLFGVESTAGLTIQDLMPGIDVTAAEWEGPMRSDDGNTSVVRVTTSLTVVGQEFERTHLVQDVTEDRATEAELRRLAIHDDLTGQLNRRGFLERLEEALAAGETGSILFIDLDGFKAVNDDHGHRAGDFVLQRVAEVVPERLAGEGRFGRIGGDEFAILWHHADNGAAGTLSEAVRDCITGLQLAIDGKPVTLDASIGGVAFPEHGSSATELMERADAAMYRAKREGGGRFVRWDEDVG
ncbi:MAG: sensor domain-containing diguanylate cyclase [Proteobacteria bacterium]|nr:sensor domain-containing diguanylate cyclase [Pseudomonadota bacterium]